MGKHCHKGMYCPDLFLFMGEWVVFHGGGWFVVVGVSAAEAVDAYLSGHDMDEEVE